MLPGETHVGCVTLRVASLDVALGFYAAVLGLHPSEGAEGSTELRADRDGAPLLRLVERPGARAQPVRAAGLFHTAFLLPSRAQLGLALRQISSVGWPLTGGSDHGVSEALYLNDPDGNGVEIYADRPREQWTRNGTSIAMTTLPLNVAELSSAAVASGEKWSGFPSKTVVGHVHLRVPSVEEGRVLFAQVLGMDITADTYPGALFFAAGGYHHHVAVNIWEGRNVPPLPEDAAGLIEFEILLPDSSAIAGMVERAAEAGVDVQVVAGGVALTHAGGIRVLVLSPADK